MADTVSNRKGNSKIIGWRGQLFRCTRPGACAGVLAVAGLLALTLPGQSDSQTTGEEAPEVPKIMSVSVLPVQPQESDTATIWYDDFSTDKTEYTEKENDPDYTVGFGGTVGSLPGIYAKNSQGTGNRKIFFGDSPTGNVLRPGEHFEDVYWRFYVMHQYGWTGGGPAKLTRITSIVSSNWAQAMICHVWSSNESLTLDPASLVVGDKVLSTTYNDFNAMHWLGNQPVTDLKIFSTAECGWWVCVEVRCKLNTPGLSDGEAQLWLDGRLESVRKNMNFRGSYTGHTLNALFLETYWNSGSPVDQKRWTDNYVVSTHPIGPVTTSRNPTLYKMPYHGPGTQAAWEAELATSPEGAAVWHGSLTGGLTRLTVDASAGTFSGALAAKAQLDPGVRYWTRVRQQSSAGIWSDWSRWHQPFVTEGSIVQGALDCDWNSDGRATLLDVLALMLYRRDHPADPATDYDGDGRYTFMDPYRMLRDILDGRCGLTSLSGAHASLSPDEDTFSRADREYLEQAFNNLPLKGEERQMLETALDGAAARPKLPTAFFLAQNYPNPFNPRTAIPFSIPETQAPVAVSLKVYDLRNQLIRTLVDGTREAGDYSVYWDGTDEAGRTVPSGVYLYRLQAGEYSSTRKMVLLR